MCAGRGAAPTGARQRAANTAGARYSSDECGLASLLRAAVKEESPYEGPFYIVFNASGGWDTTYLMDPKGINEMNRLYKEGDILTKGAHKFAPTAKHKSGGLSNEDFYSEFGSELLTLNGLDYSVNNH